MPVDFFLLFPIEGPNYVRIEDDVVDDFADVTEEEELVTDSNTITKAESHTAIEANEVIEKLTFSFEGPLTKVIFFPTTGDNMPR